MSQSFDVKATPFWKYDFYIKRLCRRRIRKFIRGLYDVMATPILEVGAGYKTNYENINKDPYHTLDHVSDFNPTYVTRLQDMDGVPPKYYNTIIATEVLEHIANPDKVIFNIFHLLRPGGRFIITIPFWFGIHEKPWQQDYFRYTPSGIRYLLEAQGFTIELLETHGWRKNRPDNIFVVARKDSPNGRVGTKN